MGILYLEFDFHYLRPFFSYSSDMVNVSVVDPGEGEETKEGMIGPVQSQGSVRINCPTNVCEEKCYSKVVVGKHGSYKVTTHTRRCRLSKSMRFFKIMVEQEFNLI